MAKVIPSSRGTLHGGRQPIAYVLPNKPLRTTLDDTVFDDVKLIDKKFRELRHEDLHWTIVKREPLAVYLRPNDIVEIKLEKHPCIPIKNGLKQVNENWKDIGQTDNWHQPKLSEEIADDGDIPEKDKVLLNFDDDETVSRFSRIDLSLWNEPAALARLLLPVKCKELCFLARNFLIRTWFKHPDRFLELDVVLGHPVILQYGRQFVHALRADEQQQQLPPPAVGSGAGAAAAGLKWYQIVRNLHRYLTRHAHINFGHCLRDLSRVDNRSFSCANAEKQQNSGISVVVVGAGLAGLAAARHLLNLGCVGSIKILESRSQPGGRVNTVWCKNLLPPESLLNGAANHIETKPTLRNGLKNRVVPHRGRHGRVARKTEESITNGNIEHAADSRARAELGAQVITGINGNPLCLIAQQLRLPLRRIAVSCSIFDKNGQVTDADRDREIEAEFNNILENASRISHFQGLEAHNGQLLSLGQVFDAVVRCNELELERMRVAQVDVAEQMLQRAQQLLQEQSCIQKRMREVLLVVKQLQTDGKATEGRQKMAPNRVGVESENKSYELGERLVPSRPSIHKIFDLQDNIGGELVPLRERYDYLQAEIDALHEESSEIAADFMKNPNLQPLYLSADDKDILCWHISNLEFANASSIGNLSLKHWDQDEHFDAVVSGDDCMMPAGLTTLCTRLASPFSVESRCQNGLHKSVGSGRARKMRNGTCNGVADPTEMLASITYDAKVTKIDYSRSDKCHVTYRISDDDEKHVTCDFVILTTSLGVLKLCCNDDDVEGDDYEFKQEVFKRPVSPGKSDVVQTTPPPPIVFSPQLPIWKRGAISRLGFGRLNKLVLVFERNFWSRHLPQPDDMLFGYADDHRRNERRGEFYIFWSMCGTAARKSSSNLNVGDKKESAVLVAMLPGNAATLSEQSDSDLGDAAAMQLATRVMHILQKLFCPPADEDVEKSTKEKQIPSPQLVIVTRWACDQNFCGTYSYVARGATGDDYDAMAAPVFAPPPLLPEKEKKAATKENGETFLKPIPRLLFAGEATIRRSPASAHGAYFSGLREAARIDAILHGPIKF